MSKVLIVDDESVICERLENVFSRRHVVKTARSGEAALEMLSQEYFDAMVLDLRMDGMDGLELLSHKKEVFPGTAVVVLTAYADMETAVASFRRSAFDFLEKGDGFLEKPVTSKQVLEKVESYLAKHSIGELLVDTKSRCAYFQEKLLDLTRMEFSVLSALVKYPNQYISYGMLAAEIHPQDGLNHERAMKRYATHINRLREKLETAAGFVMLVSSRGEGQHWTTKAKKEG